MRLDGVEIKVSIAGTEVPSALDALGIGDDGQRRGIGFIEDSTVGVELPLFHHGVVLRVREIDDDEDDSTVKLRPCRRSQVTEQWLDEGPDGRTVKIEEDWAGSRRVLAVSCVSKVSPGRIESARAGPGALRRLFNEDQERFLSDCAGMPINLEALTLLPSIAATKWERIRIRSVADVVAERWTIDDLDFLELSIRADTVAEARTKQENLEREIRALDLEPDNASESKTERVLTHLVGFPDRT